MFDPVVSERELEAEMEKKRGQQQTRPEVGPEDRPIEGIELTRRMKDVKDKRGQANKVKVQGVRSLRSFEQNKNADQEINDANDFEILLMSKELLRCFEHHR